MAFVMVLLLASCVTSGQNPNVVSGTPNTTANSVLREIDEDPIAGQFSLMEMKLEPFVFTATSFPNAEFAHPEKVRKLFGEYKINTSYYNTNFEETKTATTPGRYGAVVRITFNSGVKMNRYYTLFRCKDSVSALDWWRWAAFSKDKADMKLPGVLGIPDNIADAYRDAISNYIRFGFYEDLIRRPYSARLFASLYESPNINASDIGNDPMVRDRQWWIRLKEKLYPVDNKKPLSIKPDVINTQAKVLHLSTLKSPRLKAALLNMNSGLSQWAASSKEPFSVVLVKNGEVIFQNAFGSINGRKAQIQDAYHIASINKTLTSILLMMCVDRKIVSLNDDISNFFPSLKDAKWNRPITIRDLVKHTSGLPDLTMDEANDLEDIIKPLLPYIRVGAGYQYVETGYSLVGKILERLTGKCFAILVKEWLSDPLQLTSLKVKGAASDAWMSAMDLAKVGQLLLNEGSYGNVLYFRPETFRDMLPQKNEFQGVGLMVVSGNNAASKPVPASKVESWLKDATEDNIKLGCGQLLGHGASSGTTFAIDIQKKMVIVMTRNSFGADYELKNEQFMRSVVKNFEDTTIQLH